MLSKFHIEFNINESYHGLNFRKYNIKEPRKLPLLLKKNELAYSLIATLYDPSIYNLSKYKD